jgi:hypothetical protein
VAILVVDQAVQAVHPGALTAVAVAISLLDLAETTVAATVQAVTVVWVAATDFLAVTEQYC